ncbi:uncharacterized protein FTJAE_13977 [Fusarium tjaetaba]|uniref:Uncharacterized protein n=1 Tax=Fusarium tjaetaba TaxID=1567544 RepID=A0A8H5QD33_9HYPO|nr:uncharacterized protein FTJAE_13977 [Fusarium tjaetaba]KAF5613062.1 hypothetical protein FTJAE_13977 [Fusarium tjaetaba]
MDPSQLSLDSFVVKMNQRLDHLYRLGVLRVKLQADEQGYPTFVAMPDAPLAFSEPTNYDRKTGEELIVTATVAELGATESVISKDLELMNDFLAKSTTIATAQKLADGGHTLTRCPQAMARIIRYEGGIEDKQGWWDSIVGDVKERHNKKTFKLINDFSDEMAQARDEKGRAYAVGNVARAAEHLKEFLKWQRNADLMGAMKDAMNGFEWSSSPSSSGDQSMRSSPER